MCEPMTSRDERLRFDELSNAGSNMVDCPINVTGGVGDFSGRPVNKTSRREQVHQSLAPSNSVNTIENVIDMPRFYFTLAEFHVK